MMMNRTPVAILFFLLSINCYSQQISNSFPRQSKHTLFLEIGGNSPIYSVNYEFQFLKLNNSTFVQSLGFEIPHFDEKREYFINGEIIEQRRLDLAFFPLRFNWISHSNRKNHLELGFGATYYTSSLIITTIDMIKEIKLNPAGGVFLIPSIGYRSTPKSGFLFRATVSPYFSRTVNPQFQFYGGVSFGYNFKKKK